MAKAHLNSCSSFPSEIFWNLSAIKSLWIHTYQQFCTGTKMRYRLSQYLVPFLESQQLLATQFKWKQKKCKARFYKRICFSTYKIVNSILHDVFTTEKRTQDTLDGILKRKRDEAAVVFRKQASLGTPAAARSIRAAHMQPARHLFPANRQECKAMLDKSRLIAG